MSENHKKTGHPEKAEAPAEEKTVTIFESEYAALKQESAKAQEYWDRLLRLQADFENVRKRLERDRQDYAKYANEGLILEMLNVLDDLERAAELAQAKHQDMSAFLKGVEMILAHLYEALKIHGVKQIEAQGKPFDPNYHEALMQAENKDLPEHTVIEELQKGYMLFEKVIRTAKVKVSKNAGEEK